MDRVKLTARTEQAALEEILRSLISDFFVLGSEFYLALSYSVYTQCWYITNNGSLIFIRPKGECHDEQILEHKQTPIEAADAFIEQLKNAEYFYTTIDKSNTTRKIPSAYLHKLRNFPLKFYRYDADSDTFLSIVVPEEYNDLLDLVY